MDMNAIDGLGIGVPVAVLYRAVTADPPHFHAVLDAGRGRDPATVGGTPGRGQFEAIPVAPVVPVGVLHRAVGTDPPHFHATGNARHRFDAATGRRAAGGG